MKNILDKSVFDLSNNKELTKKEKELFDKINNIDKTSFIKNKKGSGTINTLSKIAEKINLKFIVINTVEIDDIKSSVLTDIIDSANRENSIIVFDEFNRATSDVKKEILRKLTISELVNNKETFIVINY